MSNSFKNPMELRKKADKNKTLHESFNVAKGKGVDFSTLKKEVDLIVYANFKYKYNIDFKQSKPNSIIMTNYLDDRIEIKKNTKGEFMYRNLSNKFFEDKLTGERVADKGSIINFIRFREEASIQDINMHFYKSSFPYKTLNDIDFFKGKIGYSKIQEFLNPQHIKPTLAESFKLDSKGRLSFEEIKKKVDLLTYAHFAYGFIIDKEKSGNLNTSISSIKMNNPTTGESILIKKNNNGDMVYSNIDYQEKFSQKLQKKLINSGSIINFIQFQSEIEFKDTAKELYRSGFTDLTLDQIDELKQNIGYTSLKESSVELTDEDKTYIKQKLAKCKTGQDIETLNFLDENSISPMIRENQMFNSRIHTYTYHFYDDNKKTIRRTQVLFPLYDSLDTKSNIVGLDIRSNDPEFKRIIKGKKDQGIWYSNYNQNKPLDAVIYGESPKDCISHQELNQDSLQNKNILYISFSGKPTESQLQIVKSGLSGQEVKNHISISDNDLGGDEFNVKLVNALTKNEINLTLSNSKKLDFYSLSIQMKNIDEINQVKSKMIAFAKEKNININKIKDSKNQNNNTTVIYVEKSDTNSRHLTNFAKKIGYNENLYLTKSLMKDFNDDLKLKKGTLDIPSLSPNEKELFKKALKKKDLHPSYKNSKNSNNLAL